MFAYPAETGFFRQRLFEDGSAVDENATAVCTRVVCNLSSQRLEPAAQYFVIVASQRVAGDIGFGRVVEQLCGRRLLLRQVIHAYGNDADGARDQFRGSAPLQAMLVHIVHFAVELPGQPLGQALLGLLQIDIADACLLKTKLFSPLLYTNCQVLQVGLADFTYLIQSDDPRYQPV